MIKLSGCLAFFLLLFEAQAFAQQSTATSNPDSEYAFLPIKDVAPDTAEKANALGADIMLGNSGFGLGFFYRQSIGGSLSWTISISGSEAKAPNEMETYYYDFYGNIQKTVIGKVNQLFVFPAMIGLQYRLFKDDITDSFRPYVLAGVGPNVVLSMPYDQPFSRSVAGAHSYFGLGGYVGGGAYFGLDQNSLFGVSLRYYILPMSRGIESLQGQPMSNFSTFFLAFNIATQF